VCVAFCEGYSDDSRNTDNAWMETMCVVFKASPSQVEKLIFQEQEGETLTVAWISLSSLIDPANRQDLFASHYKLINLAERSLSSFPKSLKSAPPPSVSYSESRAFLPPKFFMHSPPAPGAEVAGTAPSTHVKALSKERYPRHRMSVPPDKVSWQVQKICLFAVELAPF